MRKEGAKNWAGKRGSKRCGREGNTEINKGKKEDGERWWTGSRAAQGVWPETLIASFPQWLGAVSLIFQSCRILPLDPGFAELMGRP